MNQNKEDILIYNEDDITISKKIKTNARGVPFTLKNQIKGEGAFYKKPSIIFTDTPYSDLPFIKRIKNLEELPAVVRYCLETKFDFSYLANYIETLLENSIEIKFHQLYTAINLEFFYNGIIKDVNNRKTYSQIRIFHGFY